MCKTTLRDEKPRGFPRCPFGRKLFKSARNKKFMSSPCDRCFNFKAFGNKCWFYWENKKTCSQFKKTLEDEPHVESDE